jgi:uncharacterized protein YdaU (DUF1376 family)
VNYYRRFPGDYLIDTLNLSWLEDCAYTRLLDYQYRTERSIERLTEALEITRARTPEQEEATRTIYERFFPSGINPRFEKELIHTNGKRCQLKAASALGVAARRKKPSGQSNGKPSGEPFGLSHQTPDTRHQTPEKEEKLEAPRTKRATPLLDGFELDADLMLFAEENGVDPFGEFAAFRDHHKARGSTFRDWPAAWRQWVRKAKQFNQGGKASGTGSSGNHGKSFDRIRNEGTDAALARILEQSRASVAKTRAPLPARNGPGGPPHLHGRLAASSDRKN